MFEKGFEMWGYAPEEPSPSPFWGYAPAAAQTDGGPAEARPRRSRLATASLIVGIVGAVLAVLTLIAPGLIARIVALVPTVTLGILAVVFAAMVFTRVRRSPLAGRALARAGLVLGIVDLSLAGVMLAALLVVLLVRVMMPGLL